VITDSDGLQEDTTALGIPCMNIRKNTERPITLEMGSNLLAGTRQDSILDAFWASLSRRGHGFGIPPQWDGQASGRTWEIILETYGES
jgi:UDP-N-acetylglucosamine 2-epimerase (non-hydrolysing)